MSPGFDVLVVRNGRELVVGALTHNPFGWRFLPHTTAHQPSRKSWASPDEAVPRWVGDYTLRARAPKERT